MSATSDKRSEEFLGMSGQFQLGSLVTESSHPVTARLDEAAREDIAKGLDVLFQADGDVLAAYGAIAASGKIEAMARLILNRLRKGGRVYFTGCGATGRLSILLVAAWRDFWQRRGRAGGGADWEQRAFSVMAGGDFAVIKSVEGFEDFARFGEKQLGDLGVSAGDVVIAITEGGETSFVIGTAWKAVEAGAEVYFVYNNPDEVLCRHVHRSREVIEEPRIRKLNLTTGPMSVTGSTRMQATTIQLCVLFTVLEIVVRDLAGDPRLSGVPEVFLSHFTELHRSLRSGSTLASLAGLVALEEDVYRAGRKNNYHADRFAMDVLTDTTERSPTFCTPPFRRFGDDSAAASWSFLFLPYSTSEQAWERLLRREPVCVEWSAEELRGLVDDAAFARLRGTLPRITCAELMRFRIGLDGLSERRVGPGDSAVGILHSGEAGLLGPGEFLHRQLSAAVAAGAGAGLICLGDGAVLAAVDAAFSRIVSHGRGAAVLVPVPQNEFLLDGVARAGLKMLLNALSTCTMVRLGRVMGNTMIWVVPSNLKLIDRATRYVRGLTGLDYQASNRLLFEVLEYVEPRMKSDQSYPPVVGVAALRARRGLTNEEAERVLKAGVMD